MKAWADNFSVRRPVRFITERYQRLTAEIDEKRRQKDRLTRLLENDDFLAWLDEDVTNLCRQTRHILFQPETKGSQNDVCKIVLSILETFRSANVRKTLQQIEDKIAKLCRDRQGEA